MGKKLFLSYKYAGVDTDELSIELEELSKVLMAQGYTVYNSLSQVSVLDERGFSKEEKYEYFLDQQTTCDAVIAYIAHREPSHGMQLELHRAKQLGQPLILLIQQKLLAVGAFDSFTSYTHQTISFESFHQLIGVLQSHDLHLGGDSIQDNNV